MPPHSILITYTLHPTPPADPSQPPDPPRDPLQDALAGIQSQLPLRNLHWKSASRTSLRTIQEVGVNLVELGEVGNGGKEAGGSVLDWPLVNLCLVSCEDAETYKSQTRSFIRDWLSLLSARRNAHAPLIILVNPPTSTASRSGKNVFGRDTGILGKLKADFNTGKRDRCVQVNLPSGFVSSTQPLSGSTSGVSQDPAVWVEVVTRLKESIVVAFDGAILEREEEVKRGESQRMVVGWNFCTWFLLKESLAHSFEGVNLHEDALIVYEELEATFFQVLKEQNLSWFGRLGANGPKDDSLPILDAAAKPYRELLRASSISIFDFRVYVFARQGRLLGKLGRITEIAKRGQWFVASLTRRLRESEADLAEHFVESWTYTGCMDIVQRCDEWSRIDRPNGDYSGLVAYESARSELLDIARIQVERIGVSAGHLPDQYPFSPPTILIAPTDDILFESSSVGGSDLGDEEAPAPRARLTNRQLTEALSDVHKFRSLYLALTKKVILAYEACGKANSVIRLKADLAALALYTNEWPAAYELNRNLAKDCADLFVWDPVAQFTLEGALRAHRELALERNEEWINLALAYMRVCALDGDQHEAPVELETITRGLGDCRISKSVANHGAFQLRVVDRTAQSGEDADLTRMSIELENRLPLELAADALRVELENADGDRIVYATKGLRLQPGKNLVTLSCSTSVQGLFTVCWAELQIGSVAFHYPSRDDPATLHVRRNDKAPRAVLRMPFDMSPSLRFFHPDSSLTFALDGEQSVVLEVHAELCGMLGSRISIIPMDSDIHYYHDAASSDDTPVSGAEDFVTFGNLEAGDSVAIVVPYHGISRGDKSRARVFLSYESASHPGQTRSYLDVQTISVGLPLTVNVQDFFRPDCLVSHFTIASDGRECLRIGSVELKTPADQSYMVDTCRQTWTEHQTVIPSQSLACLFKIRPTNHSAGPAVLRLVIRYMTVEEEVRRIIEDGLAAVPSASPKLSRAVNEFIRDRPSWLQSFIASGDLSSSLALYLKPMQGIERQNAEKEALIAALAEGNDPAGQWRTLEIPVDVPQRRLLTTVHIERTSSDGLIYEGRALALVLWLKSSFAWAGGELADQPKLVFDVQANPDDWLILGKKKGYYIADPDSAEEAEIVLVPMRAGTIFLPTVSVHMLVPISASLTSAGPGERGEREGLICETYVDNAAEVVHVLPAKTSTTAMVAVHRSVSEVDWVRD